MLECACVWRPATPRCQGAARDPLGALWHRPCVWTASLSPPNGLESGLTVRYRFVAWAGAKTAPWTDPFAAIYLPLLCMLALPLAHTAPAHIVPYHTPLAKTRWLKLCSLTLFCFFYCVKFVMFRLFIKFVQFVL